LPRMVTATPLRAARAATASSRKGESSSTTNTSSTSPSSWSSSGSGSGCTPPTVARTTSPATPCSARRSLVVAAGTPVARMARRPCPSRWNSPAAAIACRAHSSRSGISRRMRRALTGMGVSAAGSRTNPVTRGSLKGPHRTDARVWAARVMIRIKTGSRLASDSSKACRVMSWACCGVAGSSTGRCSIGPRCR